MNATEQRTAALDPASSNPTMSAPEILLSFKGRVDRKTFWAVQLSIIALLAAIGPSTDRSRPDIAALVFGFAVLWVSLSIQVKRWHDIGFSAWALLFYLVPLVGPLLSLVTLAVLPGTEGANGFGPGPLVSMRPRPLHGDSSRNVGVR